MLKRIHKEYQKYWNQQVVISPSPVQPPRSWRPLMFATQEKTEECCCTVHRIASEVGAAARGAGGTSRDQLSEESLNEIPSWRPEPLTSRSISGFQVEHSEAKRYPLAGPSCVAPNNPSAPETCSEEQLPKAHEIVTTARLRRRVSPTPRPAFAVCDIVWSN